MLKRIWHAITAYLNPRWRSLCCPSCGLLLTERSGVHMTIAIRRHNETCGLRKMAGLK